MLTLDPDFECYDIVSVTDRNHFTFVYYFEPGENVPEDTAVRCFDYKIRGVFDAKRDDEHGHGDFVAKVHSSIKYSANLKSALM